MLVWDMQWLWKSGMHCIFQSQILGDFTVLLVKLWFNFKSNEGTTVLLKNFPIRLPWSYAIMVRLCLHHCLKKAFLNQALAWFPEIILQKVYVCMYVCVWIICLSFRTHESKPFKGNALKTKKTLNTLTHR